MKTWGPWQPSSEAGVYREQRDADGIWCDSQWVTPELMNALEATIAAQDARIAGLVEAATMTYKLLAEHDIAELHPLAIVNCLDVMSHALAAAAETSEEET